jgi:hypothetical protein
MAVSYTSREQIEVYRFNWPVAIAAPLLAIFLQAFLPLRLPFFSIFDLPLLVVIFFAMARRSQVAGLMTGAIIGILQDSLTHHPLGVDGIAKTVVGRRKRWHPVACNHRVLRRPPGNLLHHRARPRGPGSALELVARTMVSIGKCRVGCGVVYADGPTQTESVTIVQGSGPFVGRQLSVPAKTSFVHVPSAMFQSAVDVPLL